MSHFSAGMFIDGRYRVTGRLGSGSMGIVYRGEDVALGRPVAIKVIEPAAAADPVAARRFISEARALAKIRHENIVQVYSYGQHAGTPYFAMEYVSGRSVGALIAESAAKTKPFDLEHAFRILRAVARGLDAVHAEGLLHRDVKPDNIVIEEGTGRPVLIDFGLARKTTNSLGGLAVGGTPSYMAPEQATDRDGSKTLPASDLYSLACTAFELITSHAVYDGKDIFEVLVKHFEASPPRVSAYRPDLSALDTVFARALAKRADLRHPSCAELVRDLENAVRREPPPSTVRRRTLVNAARVLALEPDGSLARQLARAAERVGAAVECFAAPAELLAAFDQGPAAAVIIDADLLGTSTEHIVRSLRARERGAAVEVLVLDRHLDSRLPRELQIRELPKPLNMQVFTAVLSRALAPRATG